jgi:4-amino-4-deoxy-L-arabinose transferase-like glycosyltransferase
LIASASQPDLIGSRGLLKGSVESPNWAARVTALHVFFFALAVQWTFLLLLPHSARVNDSTDFARYYNPVAQNLLSGRGPVLDSGEFGSLYPVGFPMVLAGEYYLSSWLRLDRMLLVAHANVLLMAIACVIVFLIARRLFTPEIAAISAVLWSTCLFNLWLIKQPNSEVPFIPLLLASIYALVLCFEERSARWAAACGFLLGLGALIRPIVLFLPFLLALCALLNRDLKRARRLLIAVFLVGAFALAIAPWEFDLYSHTGHLVPLSTNGASSIFDGLTYSRRAGARGVPAPALLVMTDIALHTSGSQSAGDILRFVLAEAMAHPGAVAELYALKLARSWYGTDSGLHERPILLLQIFYLGLAAAGLWLISRSFRLRRYYLGLFVVMVFYFWGMAVLALSIVRYLVPAMAFLLIPAAAVPAMLVARLTRRRAG